MTVSRSPWKQSAEQKATRRWNEERSLRRAMKIARIGYWEASSADANSLRLAPDFISSYNLKTRDGLLDVFETQDSALSSSEQLSERLTACWSDGRSFSTDVRLPQNDGKWLDCIVQGEAEYGSSGGVLRVFGFISDVTAERSALRRMAECEERFADFLGTASDWCWESGPDHRLLPYPQSLDGSAALQSVALGGKARWELAFAPEERDAMARHKADMEAHRPFRDFVYTSIGIDGSRISIRTSGKPIYAGDGTFKGYRGTASDITQLSAARDLLNQRTRALEDAHRLGKIGTWHYRLDTGHTEWSAELYHLLGLNPKTFEPSEQSTRPFFLDNDADRLTRMQRRTLRSTKTESSDFRITHMDGTTRDLAVICKAEILHGEVKGIIGTVQDVTDRKEAERNLKQLAYTDMLTGLANRALFRDRLTAVLHRSHPAGRRYALLIIDLDRFKEVNDSLGHSAGDSVLVGVAEVLRRELGASAFVARFGGDEFAVLIESSNGPTADPMAIANRLIARLSTPMNLPEGEACIGATIGIALLPEHGSTADIAQRNADLALYMAKEAGRGRPQLFDPSHAQAAAQKLDLGRRLRHAVETGSLEAHYQPQVDLRTGRVTGFEALLRWSHPERGPISPAEFIPIAESTGLIVELGQWVLRAACMQMRRWLDEGMPPRTVSVNVSPAQIINGDFDAVVRSVLAETNIAPELLCLELTESLFVDHTREKVSATLAALSRLGVKLALDDFGSGYSSLGYLTRLPFDRLKIDRSFVDGIATSDEKRRLLGGMIALSHGLRMTVIAEGAELPAEVDCLKEFSCDVVQGYVFSRPVAAEQALAVASELEAAMI